MLQVGVHHAHEPAPGHVQAGDHRGAQPAHAVGALAQQVADLGGPGGQLGEHLGRRVVAVVDEAHLEGGRAERRARSLPEGADVGRLVARGHDHADEWRRGGHRPRIGGGRPRPWAAYALLEPPKRF